MSKRSKLPRRSPVVWNPITKRAQVLDGRAGERAFVYAAVIEAREGLRRRLFVTRR